MRFRNFPELVLGSKTKLRVLLHLLAEPSIPSSEREVAKLIGTSHTAVNKVMKDFYDAHLVTPIRIGNVNAWKLNEKSYAYWAISDIARLVKSPPIEKLKEDIINCFTGFVNVYHAVVFGSIAEGKESPDSDIDLLLVVKDEETKKVIREQAISGLNEHCVKFYGNKLSPFIVTQKEFETTKNRQLVEKGILVLIQSPTSASLSVNMGRRGVSTVAYHFG